MSLEEQIRDLSPFAASTLASKLYLPELYALYRQCLSTVFLISSYLFSGAGIKEDIDIQELTRDDLNELLPGLEHFKLRKKISELLTQSKQVGIAPKASIVTIPLCGIIQYS